MEAERLVGLLDFAADLACIVLLLLLVMLDNGIRSESRTEAASSA